jgi:hypothetical protein
MLPLIEFEFEYNKELLLAQANDMVGYEPFIDPLDGKVFNGWLIKRVDNGYAQEMTNYFQELFDLEDCRPRFYIQKPGFSLGFHKDRGTTCSFNFLLSDKPDVINFRDFDCSYKIGLLNTQAEHAVLNVTSERVLFKISVFDKTFEEIGNVLSYKLSSR